MKRKAGAEASEKRRVVEEHLFQGKSLKRLALLNDISIATICRWMKDYKRQVSEYAQNIMELSADDQTLSAAEQLSMLSQQQQLVADEDGRQPSLADFAEGLIQYERELGGYTYNFLVKYEDEKDPVYCTRVPHNGTSWMASLDFASAAYFCRDPVMGGSDFWSSAARKREVSTLVAQYVMQNMLDFYKVTERETKLNSLRNSNSFQTPKKFLIWLCSDSLAFEKQWWGSAALFPYWELHVPKALWIYHEENGCVALSAVTLDGKVYDSSYPKLLLQTIFNKEEKVTHFIYRDMCFYPIETAYIEAKIASYWDKMA